MNMSPTKEAQEAANRAWDESEAAFNRDVQMGVYSSLGVRRGVYAARRARPTCIVIHTTGAGLAQRVNPALDPRGTFDRWRQRYPQATVSTFEAGLWVYRYAMEAGPHVLIGQGGERARLCPDNLCAWHVGKRGAHVYAGSLWRATAPWWRERWPHLRSPRDLAGGTLWAGGSVNDVSLGVEVACPADDPTCEWSDAAKAALVKTVSEWCLEHQIPCTRHYVITHSDGHPTARTQGGRPTDPGPRQWPDFDDWFRELSGAPW